MPRPANSAPLLILFVYPLSQLRAHLATIMSDQAHIHAHTLDGINLDDVLGPAPAEYANQSKHDSVDSPSGVGVGVHGHGHTFQSMTDHQHQQQHHHQYDQLPHHHQQQQESVYVDPQLEHMDADGLPLLQDQAQDVASIADVAALVDITSGGHPEVGEEGHGTGDTPAAPEASVSASATAANTPSTTKKTRSREGCLICRSRRIKCDNGEYPF